MQIKCDRCLADIKETPARVIIDRNGVSFKYDLCWRCSERLRDFCDGLVEKEILNDN